MSQVGQMLKRPGLGDYFSYDERGRLHWRGISLVDLARDPATDGTPLELVDVPIVAERGRYALESARSIARELGYRGEIRMAYATKASPSAEVVTSALTVLDCEITSAQDLYHLELLRRNGLLAREPLIICNGFKPPLSLDSASVQTPSPTYHWLHQHRYPTQRMYAEEILRRMRAGRNIIPNLENLTEIAWFEQNAVLHDGIRQPPYDVGLRMAFGLAQRLEDIPGPDGRFGLPWPVLQAAAIRLAAGNRLRPVALHTMIDGASGLMSDQWHAATRMAVRQFLILRRDVRSMSMMNLGGGLPPQAKDVSLKDVLRATLQAVLEISREMSEEPPACLMWEPGSYLASESTHYLFNVAEFRAGGPSGNWAVCDVPGFQSVLPDSWAGGVPFIVLAATHANSDKLLNVTFWDATCDPDGRLPSKREGASGILFPAQEPGNDDPMLAVIVAMGAYQEALSGARGGHHCSLREAAEIMLLRPPQFGQPAELMTVAPQSRADLAGRWGYHLPELIKSLKQMVVTPSAHSEVKPALVPIATRLSGVEPVRW